MNDKIQPVHRERPAVVYLRQSTLRQVVEHGESTARQYGLKQRAIELGWSSDRVVVVDEDLGLSGSSAEARRGFQRLADDVAHGRVGAIFALEASRLARHSADWHRLLDLCRLADVVIADDQSVYAPRDYNDQLLLGLKGTMAEAELVWMRRRLQGGKLNKARRGELRQSAPTGYVWDLERRCLVLDPDEQVQRSVRLVFERFRIAGSARGVTRYFARHGIHFPAGEREDGQKRWRVPDPSTILRMLHNPAYAGVYVFGRTEERAALVDGVVRRRQVRRLPPEEWVVSLRGRHEGYIEWEEFVANERKLQENRTNHDRPEQRGAARDGEALLQGLALCGRCGRRMTVRYPRRGRTVYLCSGRGYKRGEGNSCWSASADPIDEEVTRLFLAAVQPPELELSLAVAREAERQASDLDRQWKLRLERSEYEARLAERRYKAVDPDYRVVAGTLERDWEQRLRDLEAVRRDYAEAKAERAIDLDPQARARILQLARDLPALWRAATTSMAERKTLLRLVVREVALSPVEVPKRCVRIAVLWETGAVSEALATRRNAAWRFATPSAAHALIHTAFAEGCDDEAIAATLREHGLQTGRERPWTAAAVAFVRHELRLLRPKGPPQGQRADGLYSTRGVALHFGVVPETVLYWVERGWLKPVERGGGGRPSWYRLDADTIHRLESLRHRRRSEWSVPGPSSHGGAS